MDRALIQKVVDEARSEEANLVIWDRRDTFTVEQDDLADLEVDDDYLRVKMQEGKVTVYVELPQVRDTRRVRRRDKLAFHLFLCAEPC